MRAKALTCPFCSAVVPVTQPLSPDQPIVCRACLQSFAAQPAAAIKNAVPVAAPFAAPPAPLAGIRADKPSIPVQPFAHVPTAAPARPAAPGKSLDAGLLGLILLVVFLVGSGVVAGVVLLVTASTAESTKAPEKAPEPLLAKGDDFVPPVVPQPQVSIPKDTPAPETPAKTTPPTPPHKKASPPPEKIQPVSQVKPAPPPGDEHRSHLSKEQQKLVNQAVDRGVQYLRKTQKFDGRWQGAWPIGTTALGGLTLLECGVPAKDPAVQKAAAFVRAHYAEVVNRQTYQFSLVILFLDRLGDPKDNPRIRHLALRLIAGQTAAGGWDYNLPQLTPRENDELLTILMRNRPDLAIPLAKGDSPELVIPISTGNNDGGSRLPKAPGDVVNPKDLGKVAKASWKVQNLPIVQQKPLPKALVKGKVAKNSFFLKNGRDDNSNTQFAMIALWAARRHGIPVEQTLALVEQRFVNSQHPAGTWAYQFGGWGATPQMTCVGLIGLALGHGAYKDAYGNAWKDKEAVASVLEDPHIKKGLKALAKSVGTPPANWNQATPVANLYFLWSLERTAMLYNLKTVGGKDWYGWSAQMLVASQQPSGNWQNGGYHGANAHLDTCLALLVLQRANLVQDLTQSLRLYIPVADTGP